MRRDLFKFVKDPSGERAEGKQFSYDFSLLTANMEAAEE
jgi:hypothetical protein